MNMQMRSELIDALEPFIPDWFAMWFYPDAVWAKDVYQPRWEKIPYGPLAVQRLRFAARPYRYTMRRKIRKAYGL